LAELVDKEEMRRLRASYLRDEVRRKVKASGHMLECHACGVSEVTTLTMTEDIERQGWALMHGLGLAPAPEPQRHFCGCPDGLCRSLPGCYMTETAPL